eukprot:1992626-Amphidinium_carterae.1
MGRSILFAEERKDARHEQETAPSVLLEGRLKTHLQQKRPTRETEGSRNQRCPSAWPSAAVAENWCGDSDDSWTECECNQNRPRMG